MTLTELQTATLERIGEDAAAPVYYTETQAVAALNWAQRLFVLISLCVERTSSFTLTAATTYHHVLSQITYWLLPLAVTYCDIRLRPARLAELDALDAGWQASAGDPERYCVSGLDLLAVYRQLAAGGSLSLIYAAAPAKLAAGADVPEIPEEYHPLLPGAAIALLRMKEGGQEFEKARPGLQALIAGAGRLAAYVRRRNLDLRYDSTPIEIERFDLSRVLAISKKRAPWLITSDTPPAAVQQ